MLAFFKKVLRALGTNVVMFWNHPLLGLLDQSIGGDALGEGFQEYYG